MLTLTVLLLLGFGFLVYCLRTPRPEHAVYGYLVVWILCPKWARFANIGVLPGNWGDELFIFDIVNAIAVAVLLVVWAVRRPRTRPRYARAINWIIFSFLAMTVVSLVSGIHFAQVRGWDPDVLTTYVRPSWTMVYGAIFGAAFLRYIDTRRKIEQVLVCFALSGIELTAEAVLLYYLNVIPALRPPAVNFAGRFQSLTYLSFDTVGLVSVIAICSMLYFAITRRSLLWLALVPAMFVPIIATSQRAPLSAAALSLCAFGFFLVPRRYAKRCFVLGICGLGAALWYLGANYGDLPTTLNRRFGGVADPNSTLQQTFYIRVGLWLRSLDIFLYNFPLGAGNGLVDYHMSAPVPAHFHGVVEGAAYNYYWLVVNDHTYWTKTHNAFLEFIVENGVLGVLMLCAWGGIIIRRFRQFVVLRGRGYGMNDRGYVAQACLYACMMGMGWRYLFESNDKLYFLLFAMLAMISLLADCDLRQSARRRERAVPAPEMMTAAKG